MNERDFQMRLACRYQDPDNAVVDLRVEHLDDGEWKPFDLHIGSPGFQIFVYAALTCQHMYFRVNCAERGLMLESARGSVHMLTREDWELKRVRIDYEGTLKSGSPSDDDLDYLVERMKLCPVSKNTKAVADSETTVTLV